MAEPGASEGQVPQPAEVRRPDRNPVAQKLAQVAANLKNPDSDNTPIVERYADLFNDLRNDLDINSSQAISELVLEGVIGNFRRSLSPNGRPLSEDQEKHVKSYSEATIEQWFKKGFIGRDQVMDLNKAYGI